MRRYGCFVFGPPPAVVGLCLALALATVGCARVRAWRAAEPPPIDLNTATRSKIARLPGITPSLADAIVKGRPYGEASDLVTHGVLTRDELERLEGRVMVETAH